MTTKISEDMYPLNELRKEYNKRVKSTGFFNTKPNVLVSLHIFSNIIASTECSSRYGKIMEEALSNISFYTAAGYIKFNEVDYMFINVDQLCVAVLKDGRDFLVLEENDGCIFRPIEIDTPLNLIVSTKLLKGYYIEHSDDFQYLNTMANVIEKMGIKHSDVSKHIKNVSIKCRGNAWIMNNINHCLDDLDKLFRKSSFVLCKTK